MKSQRDSGDHFLDSQQMTAPTAKPASSHHFQARSGWITGVVFILYYVFSRAHHVASNEGANSADKMGNYYGPLVTGLMDSLDMRLQSLSFQQFSSRATTYSPSHHQLPLLSSSAPDPSLEPPTRGSPNLTQPTTRSSNGSK